MVKVWYIIAWCLIYCTAKLIFSRLMKRNSFKRDRHYIQIFDYLNLNAYWTKLLAISSYYLILPRVYSVLLLMTWWSQHRSTNGQIRSRRRLHGKTKLINFWLVDFVSESDLINLSTRMDPRKPDSKHGWLIFSLHLQLYENPMQDAKPIKKLRWKIGTIFINFETNSSRRL